MQEYRCTQVPANSDRVEEQADLVFAQLRQTLEEQPLQTVLQDAPQIAHAALLPGPACLSRDDQGSEVNGLHHLGGRVVVGLGLNRASASIEPSGS